MSNEYRIGKNDTRELTLQQNGVSTVVDISQIAYRIFVYEGIFETYMSGAVDVMDGTSLRSILPMSGGELISMDVGERNGRRRLKNKYVAYKMSAKQQHNIDLEFYTLNLCSMEQLVDSTISVSKSYVKPIHEIIANIVSEYLTPINGKTLIEVEETKGIQSLTFTGISPMAAIKQCIREAESIDNPASIYVFYETIEGFHFVTLDYLYRMSPYHVFVWDESLTSEGTVGESQYLNNLITHLNFEDSFDIMDGQMGGQYRTQVQHFDPLTKSFRTQEYDYSRDSTPSRGQYSTIANSAYSQYFSQATHTRFIMTNSHRSELDYVTTRENSQNIFRRRQDFMARERAVLQQYTTNRLTISVPGNSDVRAGQTVNVVIPRASDAQDERPLNDRLLSGKYLASAVAHKIQNSNGEYATVIELIRPGYEENAV